MISGCRPCPLLIQMLWWETSLPSGALRLQNVTNWFGVTVLGLFQLSLFSGGRNGQLAAPFLVAGTRHTLRRIRRVAPDRPLMPVGSPDPAALTSSCPRSSGLRGRSTRMSTISEARVPAQENEMEVEPPASAPSRRQFSVPGE